MTAPGPFRLDPAGPPGAYRTYSISVRRDTTVVAACEQVGCDAWAHGWVTRLDTATEWGRVRADYIRYQSGRIFREVHGEAGLVEFRFASRQRCFAEHRTVPELYVARGGDWRAVTSEPRRYSGAGDWVEDFGEHQQRLHEAHERG